MNNRPFLLQPAGKDYLWGGERLKTEYGKDLPLTPLAETWECSTHPDGPSVAASGEFTGRTLAEVLAENPQFLGAHYAGKSELPILVKLIDAKQDLSVQVHPDDDYAHAHEGQPGKTEMWYVLDAAPGASLVYGLRHDMTAKQLRQAIARGELGRYFQRLPVHCGDVFYIPPGTIHAIGGGILLAEVQQSSNVTYRLYDYGRKDAAGNFRPLHQKKALEVACLTHAEQVRQPLRTLRYQNGSAKERLCLCEHFKVMRLLLSDRMQYQVDGDSFACCLCIGGEGSLSAGGEELPLCKGQCVFLPAGCGEVTLSGHLELLWITG